MLNALGFSCGARGVKNKEGMLCANRYRGTHAALAFKCLCERFVTPCNHRAGGCSALVHIDRLDRFATSHGQAFVHNRFQRQLFATAHLKVRRDHGNRASINDALLQGFGGETSKNYAVGCANAGAGLHCNHAFERHGHINQYPITLLNAIGFQSIGELAHPCE